MAEVMDEATYVAHHKQKFVLVFSAMRQFAERLRARGIAVRYVRLGDPSATTSLNGEVLRALDERAFSRVVVTEPGEWRLAAAFDDLAIASPVPVEVRPDTRFICSRATFEAWAAGRSELRMEFFYRETRRATGLLMEGDKPADRPLELRSGKPQAPAQGPPGAGAGEHCAGRRHPPNHRGDCRAVPGQLRNPGRLRLCHQRRGGGDRPRRLPGARPAPLRRLSGLHARGRAGDVARPYLRGHEPRPARSSGGVSPRRGRVAGGPRAAQRRGGLHPPDPRLARIRARNLLAQRARLQDHQRPLRRPRTARVLLVWRDGHGLRRRRRRHDPRPRLRPPHPAP